MVLTIIISDPHRSPQVILSAQHSPILGALQLHLEVLVNRILNEFKVQAIVGKPSVAYRQTISRKVEVVGRHVKQSGGHGQFAVCKMIFEPCESNELVFDNKIIGGSIPREYIPSVKKGIKSACVIGGELKFPFVNIRAELFDGSFHEVDSSDMAFRMAGVLAFRQAVEKARVVLLEPYMKLEVVVPADYLGDVVGDLNSRRVEVREIATENHLRVIRGIVPLAGMFDYTTNLRSLTQGRGTHTMEPSEYAPVPEQLALKVRAARLKVLGK